MPIHIKQINIKNIGPIREMKIKTGAVTLFYGKNEKGKTHLVEFLIRTLFRKDRSWKLREQEGGGSIAVAGIADKLTELSPVSPMKLEDYIEKERAGLPLDFSRLLVVKGGELEFDAIQGGANKSTLKKYLSNQNVIDSIGKRIKSNIQSANIENGIITSPNQGEGKVYYELKTRLESIHTLFEEIDEHYSGGERQLLISRKVEIEKEIEIQNRAKRHRAFQLHTELKHLKSKKDLIPQSDIHELKSDIRLFTIKKHEMDGKRKQLVEAGEASRHFTWLESAVPVYEKLVHQGGAHPGMFLPVLTGTWLLAAIACAILRFTPGLYAALGLTLVSGVVLILKFKSQLQRVTIQDELKKIAAEFRNRFEKEMSGLTDLQEALKNCTKAHERTRFLEDQIEEETGKLFSTEQEIMEKFQQLTHDSVRPKDWKSVLIALEERRQVLDREYNDVQLQLAGLGVNEPDYVSEAPSASYDKNLLDDLNAELQNITVTLKEEEVRLEDLKRAVFAETQDKNGKTWEAQIHALMERQADITAAWRQKTAEIIGKRLVYDQLQLLRQSEDIELEKGLQSEQIQEPLKSMTGRYARLRIDDERLLVSDEFEEFDLSELSTGAREQVLLALRVGFANRITGDQPMFMILDDAFQHSDWERRERLVEQTLALTADGWQILYFTMDDHIKSLFEAKSKGITGDLTVYKLT